MELHLLKNRSFDTPDARCSHYINNLILVFVSLLLLGSTTLVEAGSVTVAWDPVSDARVTAYQVCYGPVSGQYGSGQSGSGCIVAQGRLTSTKTVSDSALLQEGNRYYFAARSVDDSGNNSAFSNEASATIPTVVSAPVASFTATPTSGTPPLAVTFSDTSTGDIASWSWTFGDGGTSTLQNPSHNYQSPGTYPVSLTVTGPGGTDIDTKTDYITVASDTGGGGDDVYQQDGGAQGLLVMEAEHFAGNLPQGGHEWTQLTDLAGFAGSAAMMALPNIGVLNNTDYVANSPRLDFKANFAKSGTHYVWLRGLATNSSENSAHLGLDGQANTSADRIDFSATGSWVWTNDTMDAVRATLDVPTPGEHTVNVWMREDGLRLDRVMLATDAGLVPSGTGPAESPIQTGSPEAPVASFSATPTSGTAPLTVMFTDASTTSTGQITSWAWDFGDGGTSTVQNPSHAYQSPGTYSVRLTVTDAGGSNTVTGTDYITVVADTGGGGTGLVAAYGFDESGGTVALDASGNNNDGTLSGPTRTSTGKFGGALSFDGVNDWVSVADSATLDLTSAMTLEAWVNPSTPSGWRTVLLKETSDGLAYALEANDDAFRPATYIVVGGQGHSAVGAAGIPLNTWTHLAATYDGADLLLFVNGNQVGTLPISGTITASASPLRIGGNAIWGEYFSGLIDEVRIYDRALSPAEIQADMVSPVW